MTHLPLSSDIYYSVAPQQSVTQLRVVLWWTTWFLKSVAGHRALLIRGLVYFQSASRVSDGDHCRFTSCISAINTRILSADTMPFHLLRRILKPTDNHYRLTCLQLLFITLQPSLRDTLLSFPCTVFSITDYFCHYCFYIFLEDSSIFVLVVSSVS